MAKGQRRSNREAKKPKKEKVQAPAAPSTVTSRIAAGGFTPGKKK